MGRAESYGTHDAATLRATSERLAVLASDFAAVAARLEDKKIAQVTVAKEKQRVDAIAGLDNFLGAVMRAIGEEIENRGRTKPVKGKKSVSE